MLDFIMFSLEDTVSSTHVFYLQYNLKLWPGASQERTTTSFLRFSKHS